MSGLRLTRRGKAVGLTLAFVFGIATGPWSYYDYSAYTHNHQPSIEETLP